MTLLFLELHLILSQILLALFAFNFFFQKLINLCYHHNFQSNLIQHLFTPEVLEYFLLVSLFLSLSLLQSILYSDARMIYFNMSIDIIYLFKTFLWLLQGSFGIEVKVMISASCAKIIMSHFNFPPSQPSSYTLGMFL